MGGTITVETVLSMLRKLPLRDRLKVIRLALSEAEEILPESPRQLQSLWGLCADLGPAPSADEIDEIRYTIWADFPRDDVA